MLASRSLAWKQIVQAPLRPSEIRLGPLVGKGLKGGGGARSGPRLEDCGGGLQEDQEQEHSETESSTGVVGGEGRFVEIMGR